MNLQEIETNVAQLDLSKGFDLIYDLLRAYGLPKASITRLQTGTYNRSDADNERLWKAKLYYRFIESDEEDLHAAIDAARSDARIVKERPRFLIVRDATRLLAVDTKTDTTLDTPLADLPSHSAFFLPWAGIEKTQLENLNYADRKAAEKMAKLYDEIVKHNAITDECDVRHLNVFFSRLLFCFFAEDTAVFEKGSFTNAIASLTKDDGSDTGTFLDALFSVLNTDVGARVGVPAYLQTFGYVNGSLFDADAPSPQFSARARRIILECGTLDWSQINPDIFGSMIQAVVHPGQRESLGMHYTSVENIMKVIRPLFLDELEESLASADTIGKLQRLLTRICDIKIFDPACGSGNFLVIAYKELRKIEHRVLVRIGEMDPHATGLFKLSGIKLDHFYGIEIDDFAHEVAILSLWLAKHQMNVEFHELFGVEISLIPLKDTGNVTCGNATRMDWSDVCPLPADGEVYVCGNPPYRGATYQTQQNKEDLSAAFDPLDHDRNLDYVAAWFMKGARYVADGAAGVGFVSTNSICQGTQVAMLWPHILALGVEISFAHTSFLWSNQAKGKAGVTVVVVGLSKSPARRWLVTGDHRKQVACISPYLIPADRPVVVRGKRKPMGDVPPMTFGSKPSDGGHLLMSVEETAELLEAHPEAQRFVRKYMGGAELLRGLQRFCLWIEDEDRDAAMQIPFILARTHAVSSFRKRSKKPTTVAAADSPWRFQETRHRDAPSIVIPNVSSERRSYVPMGFLAGDTVVSSKAYVIYEAEPWLFGLLQSKMHMSWVRAVGGRLKNDYSYTNTICYNTFPVPELSASQRDALTLAALRVLEMREHHADKTLAHLYDPDKMPADIRSAHDNLDATVDHIYRGTGFTSDEARLEFLFKMYEAGMSAPLEDEVLHA